MTRQMSHVNPHLFTEKDAKLKGPTVIEQAYFRHFGVQPALCMLSPLQLNLMGESCALSPGLVLCCGEDRYTGVALGPRGDNHIHIEVCNHQGAPLDCSHPVALQKLLKSLLTTLKHRGYRLDGLQLVCTLANSTRPLQTAEAAVMAVAVGINRFLELGLSTSGLIKLCHQAVVEHNEFDASGQVAALVATKEHLSLMNCSKYEWQRVPLPRELTLFRIDPGLDLESFTQMKSVKLQHARQVARFFSLPSLDHLSMEQLNQARGTLSNELFGCARHLLSEQQRVLNLADALVEGRLHEISPLMKSAHLSLSKEFEIESEPASLLVDKLNGLIKEEGGARLLSSGEVIALIPKARKTSIVEQVTQEYAQRFGVYATFFNINAVSGAHSVR